MTTNTRPLLEAALRHGAIFLDVPELPQGKATRPTAPALALAARLHGNGFGVTEELLRALYAAKTDDLAEIAEAIDGVLGVKLNWAPLVKGWDVPTGETRLDHLITLFANAVKSDNDVPGTLLPCGHLIPEGTFPIERYNGCPFCGMPFVTATLDQCRAEEIHRAASAPQQKTQPRRNLRLFRLSDLAALLQSLLTSPAPLDATQQEDLKILIAHLPMPKDIAIPMKETRLFAIEALCGAGKGDEAARLFDTPTDVLRFLWFQKTGLTQLVTPKVLIARARRFNRHLWPDLDQSREASELMRENLRLRYSRAECRRAALWLNALSMDARRAAENMNPQRGIWVRFIRALRLAEFSKKSGFERLRALLEAFGARDFKTWQGQLNRALEENDVPAALALLQKRPGAFARSLFSTMLRLGADETLAAFRSVMDAVPARLLLSLGNAAETWFDSDGTSPQRLARPLSGGAPVTIAPNKLLALYDLAQKKKMAEAVNRLYAESMARRFRAEAAADGSGKMRTIFIDPCLFDIPVGVGDRSGTIQALDSALMGERFKVQGESVRLFMQWGEGLSARHLDMDLSCRISWENGRTEECAWFQLTATGARHSGDIRSIPDKVGTAEYIELSLPELKKAGAQFVTFVCSAYTCGSLSPNMKVGWMSAEHPMRLSEKTGVAYDPACVQRLVRISEDHLAKGLVFGVLSVAEGEITWLEMPFTGLTIRKLDSKAVTALLCRLRAKATIGQILALRAEAQGMALTDTPEGADETYTREWAMNPALVAKILLP